MRPAILIAPTVPIMIYDAVLEGGGRVVSDAKEANGIVWLSRQVANLAQLLNPKVGWLQLPDAGVDAYVSAGILNGPQTVTSARGCYGPQVAEHAMALVLASARRIPECAALDRWPEGPRPWGRSLQGATVSVIGAGDIGRHLIQFLTAFGARVLAVTRTGRPVDRAAETLPIGSLHDAIAVSGFTILCCPATQQNRRMMAAKEFAVMPTSAWLINIARGSLIDTGDLVTALVSKEIGGAALDVTDPEPLPYGHSLWEAPNVIITPHVANPPELKLQALSKRVAENVARLARSEALDGVVVPSRGY